MWTNRGNKDDNVNLIDESPRNHTNLDLNFVDEEIEPEGMKLKIKKNEAPKKLDLEMQNLKTARPKESDKSLSIDSDPDLYADQNEKIVDTMKNKRSPTTKNSSRAMQRKETVRYLDKDYQKTIDPERMMEQLQRYHPREFMLGEAE